MVKRPGICYWDESPLLMVKRPGICCWGKANYNNFNPSNDSKYIISLIIETVLVQYNSHEMIYFSSLELSCLSNVTNLNP